MPYIPENHKKYNLLPRCCIKSREVFEYPSRLLDKANERLEEYESATPYGYDSYDDYFTYVDSVIEKYRDDKTTSGLLIQLKDEIISMNNKEEWSVCRYIGEDIEDYFGLTHGSYYYWPCSADNPVYQGVIDDEEWTSYWYPTEEKDWVIVEDPTGMAFNTIYGKDHHGSRGKYNKVMKQIRDNFEGKHSGIGKEE